MVAELLDIEAGTLELAILLLAHLRDIFSEVHAL